MRILGRCSPSRSSDNRLCVIHLLSVSITRHGRIVIGVTRRKVTYGIRCGPLPVVATCGTLKFSVAGCPGTCGRCHGRMALPLRAHLAGRSIRFIVSGFISVVSQWDCMRAFLRTIIQSSGYFIYVALYTTSCSGRNAVSLTS